MKKDRNIGQEILSGLSEITNWQKGKKKLKTTSLPSACDVSKIRKKLKLTQEEFANFMGVNIRTLQNWEQLRREPQGPARSLLRVAEKTPGAVLKALSCNRDDNSQHKPHTQKKSSLQSKAHATNKKICPSK